MGNRKLIAAVLGAGLLGIPLLGIPALGINWAQAADITPLVRKAPVAQPVYGWAGFYAGGNLGYGFAHAANGIVNSNNQQQETFDLGATGAVGGAQIGYNWQVSPTWIVGLEADIQAANQSASACTDFCNLPQFGLTATTEQKISWFGTVRGRVGWTNGPSLFYLTGGWAYGEAKTRLIEKLSTDPYADVTFSHKKSGWTVGGGIETWLSDHWTAKGEYLYVDLGSAADSFVYLNAPLVILTPSSRIHDHVVRLGLNYHVAPGNAAVPSSVGPAPLPAAWTGFYAGANVGYGVGRNKSTLTSASVPAGTVFTGESYDVGTHGVLGGGQIGFNWQFAPRWLIGIEADLQAADVSASLCTVSCSPAPIGRLASTDQKLSWFGTVRGRLGWLNGANVFYVTGGLAAGGLETSIAELVNNRPPPIPSGHFDYTKLGWSVGGGIESQLVGNWSAKAEYLYVDLGKATETIPYPANSSNFTTQTSFHTHIARVGLNYRFGGPEVVRARN